MLAGDAVIYSLSWAGASSMAPSDVWPLRWGGQDTRQLTLCAGLTSPSPLGELSRAAGLLTWYHAAPQVGQHWLPGLLGPQSITTTASLLPHFAGARESGPAQEGIAQDGAVDRMSNPQCGGIWWGYH